jgi:hypothetical protein
MLRRVNATPAMSVRVTSDFQTFEAMDGALGDSEAVYCQGISAVDEFVAEMQVRTQKVITKEPVRHRMNPPWL